MINLNVTGVRFRLNDKIKDYVNKKIGSMDKYLPRNQRTPAHGEVILSEEDGQAKNRFTCEVTLQVPGATVSAKESTVSMYAAIDIVEEKIKTQLIKHKDKQQNNRRLRRTRRMLKDFKWRNPFAGE